MHDLDDPETVVQEHDEDFEPHAEGVDRPSALEQHRLSLGQTLATQQTARSLAAGCGDLDPPGVTLLIRELNRLQEPTVSRRSDVAVWDGCLRPRHPCHAEAPRGRAPTPAHASCPVVEVVGTPAVTSSWPYRPAWDDGR
jgi:hypothetical protein